MSGSELVEVYRAKDSPQAHLLAAALESAGITAVVQGDLLQSAGGELPVAWSAAPRILVASRDVDRAREMLAQAEATAARPRSAETDEFDACLACGAPMTDDDDKCPACGWSYMNG